MDRSRLLSLALTGLAAVGLALLAFGLFRSPASSAVEVRLAEATTTPAVPADGQIKVYVAGAVQRPGVYPVRAGDRVADALEAAGGPTADANMLAINLARRVRDEDAVIVPHQGEPAAAAANAGAGGHAGDPTAVRPLNINTATAAALETLAGIGSARAARIIDSRTKDGPFRAAADLVSRRLLPQSVYDGIKDQITVE